MAVKISLGKFKEKIITPLQSVEPNNVWPNCSGLWKKLLFKAIHWTSEKKLKIYRLILKWLTLFNTIANSTASKSQIEFP